VKKLITGLGLLLFCLVESGSLASADTLSVQQTITVHAIVAPARTVVVDQSNHILDIFSNTPDSVTPTVHMGGINGPKQSLSPSLQKQYQSIISKHKGSMVGKLYSFSSTAPDTLSFFRIATIM
jgi:hypothetical protein